MDSDKELTCKRMKKNLPAAGKAYRRPFANDIAATCVRQSQRQTQAGKSQPVLDAATGQAAAAVGEGDQG